MSAFICGDKHISSLVNWFCKNTSKLDVKQSIEAEVWDLY